MILSLLERRAARVGAATASGLLLALGLSLHPIWWVAWVAPIPLLSASLRASWKEAWALGLLAGLLGQAPSFTYLLTVTGPVLAAVFTLLNAWLWAFIVVRTRSLALRSNRWLAPFAYPALWAGVETLIAAVSPHSSWGSQAYAQMDALPVIQVASLAGPAAVTFLVCLFCVDGVARFSAGPHHAARRTGLRLACARAGDGVGLGRMAREWRTLGGSGFRGHGGHR